MDTLNVKKNLVPYKFKIPFTERTYEMEVRYNLEHDYFTVDLLWQGKPIVLGEKVVYGSQMFGDFQYLPIPRVSMIPVDPSGQLNRITFQNLGEETFIFILKEGDLDAI